VLLQGHGLNSQTQFPGGGKAVSLLDAEGLGLRLRNYKLGILVVSMTKLMSPDV
jgi:hypothetical protein